MDVCKTKKGINVSQKKFVSPALVLIRDCSDRQLPHLLPGPGRETVRFKPCVAAVLPAPGIWIPRVRPANCNLEFVRGQKKSWELMQCHQHNKLNNKLNKHIRIQDGCRKSLLWAHLFCSTTTCPERPLVPHTGRGECVSPTKYTTCWVGYWLPSHPQQHHSCCPTAYLKCNSFHHTPAGGQDILQIIAKASE